MLRYIYTFIQSIILLSILLNMIEFISSSETLVQSNFYLLFDIYTVYTIFNLIQVKIKELINYSFI